MSRKVFLSSTFLDNEHRRKLVLDAIRDLEMVAIGMERLTASAHPTVEVCLELARSCDVYVGIVAHRYGWIPTGYSRSITELEYDAAKRAGRPRLMFEIDPSVPVNFEHDVDELPDRWDKQKALDAFRAKYRADQMPALFIETELALKVYRALEAWRGPVAASALSPSATAMRLPDLAAYRVAIESQYASVLLAGFKTRLRVPLELGQVHVPLRALADRRSVGQGGFGNAEEAEKQLRESEMAAEIALVDAWVEARRRKRRAIILLGDPGSGKTTQAKHLLLACLRDGSATLGLPPDMLPVFLPLRRLSRAAGGIEAFVASVLAEDWPEAPADFVKGLLQRERLLLLLDGLDEVASVADRAVVSRWIERSAETRPNWRLFVTCRFAGYESMAQLNAQFLELHVRPLSREQADAFIRNWYRAVESGLGIERGPGDDTPFSMPPIGAGLPSAHRHQARRRSSRAAET